MAKFDFKKLVDDSADKLKNSAQKAQETLKGFDLRKAADGAAAKGKNAADYLKRKTDAAVQVAAGAAKKTEETRGLITVDGAVKLMYMVMAVDGDMAEEELSQIQEIGGELDAAFAERQRETMDECTAMVKQLDTENYREELNDLVRDVIQESLHVPSATIPVKLLLWDLLAVAQSDNHYQEDEAKLIRYIARHLEVDKSIVPEMETASRALMAIENETAWLKTTDRPFGVVEPVMKELADRKAAIMQGVHDLMND